MLHRPFASALALAFATLAIACGGTSSGAPIDNAEPELGSSSANALGAGDFATTERAGGQLDPFGCRHYQMLHLKGLDATLESKLDSADPSAMAPDGSCGGEELPKGSSTKYPLRFVEKSACGASVFEGTINWTSSGRVTRTMHLTDYRASTCANKPARVVAVVTSTFEGKTNPVGTFFSIDKP